MAYGNFVAEVGKEVGIVRRSHSWGNLLEGEFGVVTKINGHGHIFVTVGKKEMRFHRNGDAYKNEYGPRLCHAEQLRAEMKLDADRRETAKTAREVESVMKGGWNYSGNWFASKERVEELKALVAKLETMVKS
jgi:hypothetical protein